MLCWTSNETIPMWYKAPVVLARSVEDEYFVFEIDVWDWWKGTQSNRCSECGGGDSGKRSKRQISYLLVANVQMILVLVETGYFLRQEQASWVWISWFYSVIRIAHLLTRILSKTYTISITFHKCSTRSHFLRRVLLTNTCRNASCISTLFNTLQDPWQLLYFSGSIGSN